MLPHSDSAPGSVKRSGGAQHDGGSALAAGWRLRQWRQGDSTMSAAAWLRQRRWRQHKARPRSTAQRRQRGGSSTETAAVAAAQQRNVGGSLAAAQRQWQCLRWWRQTNSAALAVAVEARDSIRIADLTLEIEIFIRIMSRSSLLSCTKISMDIRVGAGCVAVRLRGNGESCQLTDLSVGSDFVQRLRGM
jgi:hypothetical protein